VAGCEQEAGGAGDDFYHRRLRLGASRALGGLAAVVAARHAVAAPQPAGARPARRPACPARPAAVRAHACWAVHAETPLSHDGHAGLYARAPAIRTPHEQSSKRRARQPKRARRAQVNAGHARATKLTYSRSKPALGFPRPGSAAAAALSALETAGSGMERRLLCRDDLKCAGQLREQPVELFWPQDDTWWPARITDVRPPSLGRCRHVGEPARRAGGVAAHGLRCTLQAARILLSPASHES
jgi:hypothetical protein